EFVRWKRSINFRRVTGVWKPYVLNRDWNIRAIDYFQRDARRLTWRDNFFGGGRFDVQAETRCDDLVQLCFFLRDPGVILKFTHRLPQLQQLRHGSGWIAGIELGNDLTNLCSNGLRIRNA